MEKQKHGSLDEGEWERFLDEEQEEKKPEIIVKIPSKPARVGKRP
jgi:hypothetical protein